MSSYNKELDPNKHGGYIAEAYSDSADNTATSNNAQIEGDKVRVHFLRHGYFPLYNHITDENDYKKEITPFVCDNYDFKKNKDITPWVESGHDLPRLTQKKGGAESFKAAVTTLRDGYLYIFDNNNIDLYYEFKVINGETYPIFWGDKNRDADKNVLDKREALERKREGWLLLPNREMSVAFSLVQWSYKYHQKVLRNKNGLRDKRCTQFRTAPFAKTNTSANASGRELNLESLKVVFRDRFVYKREEDVFDYSTSQLAIQFEERYDNIAKLEKNNQDDTQSEFKNDVFVVIYDPVGALMDIEAYFNELLEYFVCYVQGIQTGKSPLAVYNEYKFRGKPIQSIDPGLLDNTEKGISEMFTFAAQLVKFLEFESPKQSKYKAALNLNLINKILDVEGRKRLRNGLVSIKYAISVLLNDNTTFSDTENAFLDYLDVDATKLAKVSGKIFVSKMLTIMGMDINQIDGIYDSSALYKKEHKNQLLYEESVAAFLYGTNHPFKKIIKEVVDYKDVSEAFKDKLYINIFFVTAMQAFKDCAHKSGRLDSYFTILSSVQIAGNSAFKKVETEVYDSTGKLKKKKKVIIPLIPEKYLNPEYGELENINPYSSYNSAYVDDKKDPTKEKLNNTFKYLNTINSAFGVLMDNQASVDARIGYNTSLSSIDTQLARETNPAEIATLNRKRRELTATQKWWRNKHHYKVIREGSTFYRILDGAPVKTVALGLSAYNLKDASLKPDVKNYLDLAGNTIGTADAALQLSAKFSTNTAGLVSSKAYTKVIGPAGGVLSGLSNLWEAKNLTQAKDNDAAIAMAIAGVASIAGAFPSPFTPLCWVVALGAGLYASYATDDKMEKFLKHIPFASDSNINYGSDLVWKNNVRFYKSSASYYEEDYPFVKYEHVNNGNYLNISYNSTKVYSYLQAHLGFIYTLDRGFKCIEKFPSTGKLIYSGARIRKEGKAPYNLNFTNYVHGNLLSGKLPMSFFNVELESFYIDDGIIFDSATKLKITSGASTFGDDDSMYYSLNTKGVSIGIVDDLVLKVKLIEKSSGLRLPFKADEYFCVKLRQSCRAWAKHQYPAPTTYEVEDLEWFRNENADAKIKIDTVKSLKGGYTF